MISPVASVYYFDRLLSRIAADRLLLCIARPFLVCYYRLIISDTMKKVIGLLLEVKRDLEEMLAYSSANKEEIVSVYILLNIEFDILSLRVSDSAVEQQHVLTVLTCKLSFLVCTCTYTALLITV